MKDSIGFIHVIEKTDKKYIHDVDIIELTKWVTLQGEKPFRAQQIYDWLWKKRAVSFQQMSNLGSSLQEKLNCHFIIAPLVLVRKEESDDNETTKFLWRLSDGSLVESVLIRAPGRYTVCVSSQVGCPARCGFCASGRKGLIRNLASSEIVCQVLFIDAIIEKTENARVTNVVYMGMGEPMKNYENVVRSIRQLTNPTLFHMSQRRITVSTVGVVEGIIDFAKEGLKVNLVLSLHAPTQAIRQKIIPYARQYDLSDVMAAMEYYHTVQGRDITYEYTLISGINDRVEDAQELAKLLRGRQCTVNLIPYNPVAGLKLKRPERSSVEAFRSVLEKHHIIHTCRYTKGVDIGAACGQLALIEEETQDDDRAFQGQTQSKKKLLHIV